MTPITPKQKRILDFIACFTEERGYAPSQQEIADAFGYRSLGTVQNYLVRLEREGLLKRPWNSRRGLQPTLPDNAVLPSPATFTLPLVGHVAAGRPIEAIETPDQLEVPPSMVGDGDHFCLRVRGDSMIGDGILDGDYVVVRRQAHADNGQTVVALVNNEATVKRFFQQGGRVELRPANPAMAPLKVAAEDLTINGLVVGVIRHCR